MGSALLFFLSGACARGEHAVPMRGGSSGETARGAARGSAPMFLEVVGDADDRIADIEVAACAEVVNSKGRGLDDKGAVFGADVKAGTDFVREADAVERAHIRISRKVQEVGVLIVNRAVNVSADASLNEGVPVAENEAADVCA